MRPVDPACQAAREARGALVEIPMVWIDARRRDTGATVGVGIWGGEDDESVVVPLGSVSEPRFFTGAGPILQIGAVRHEAGLTIRPTVIRLATAHPAVSNAIRAFDAQGAAVTVWKRTLDPVTRKEIGVERWFKGFVNKAPMTRPVPGGEGSIEMQVVSLMRLATVKSDRRKSDAAQSRRAGDRVRRYVSVVDKQDTLWGQK